jgi:hypothetical protein
MRDLDIRQEKIPLLSVLWELTASGASTSGLKSMDSGNSKGAPAQVELIRMDADCVTQNIQKV